MFGSHLDIAKPKGNEVTTKWMVVAKRWSSISSGNKVICVCPSTLQAFHFGKNSSSVTKEKKKREPNQDFWVFEIFPKALFIGNAKVSIGLD